MFVQGCGDQGRQADSQRGSNAYVDGDETPDALQGTVETPSHCDPGSVEQLVFGIRKIKVEGQDAKPQTPVNFGIRINWKNSASWANGDPSYVGPYSFPYVDPTTDKDYPTSTDKRYGIIQDLYEYNIERQLSCWADNICSAGLWSRPNTVSNDTDLYSYTSTSSRDIESIAIVQERENVEFSTTENETVGDRPVVFSRCIRSTDVEKRSFVFWSKDEEAIYQEQLAANDEDTSVIRLSSYRSIFDNDLKSFEKFEKQAISNSRHPVQSVVFIDLSEDRVGADSRSKISCDDGFTHMSVQLGYSEIAHTISVEVTVFSDYSPLYDFRGEDPPGIVSPTSFPPNYESENGYILHVVEPHLAAEFDISPQINQDPTLISIAVKGSPNFNITDSLLEGSLLESVYINCTSEWRRSWR